MSLQRQLKRIIELHETLNRAEAAQLLDMILRGEASELELAALLAALATRGETPAEIAGFVDAMRAAATTLPLRDEERDLLVDTCGTGADLSGSFNISTAAALVAAAAGASVAKHGNRAVTSQCGSADVLEALGIPVGLTPDEGAAALRRYRFAFLHAPSLHPAMKAVMPVRRALGVRTAFHIVGPLSNPAGARAQVMGVYAPHLVLRAAEAMALLEVRHAFVVHGDTGAGGLDELSISGPSQIAEVRKSTITLNTITPEQFGLRRAPIEALRGGDAVTNAAILRAIFAGEGGPRRDIVLLNAAAVLVAADLVHDLPAGLKLAAATIDNGAVTTLIAELASGQ
ncbi:anthranilate phosphoribosyltransferase [Granulicella arctica]|uniref:Anthranilate phosphoribosyltransferase n=1 Tax=Granulicella arctica TaxID=940613 RepID=A0A7Y9PDF8_9BACT|nr:anthranilate phosphoribosyltransferase [Granulicella arctica]NYF77903.1 anthranilate phosphoribosyltransferase [Granulicella arctica]